MISASIAKVDVLRLASNGKRLIGAPVVSVLVGGGGGRCAVQTVWDGVALPVDRRPFLPCVQAEIVRQQLLTVFSFLSPSDEFCRGPQQQSTPIQPHRHKLRRHSWASSPDRAKTFVYVPQGPDRLLDSPSLQPNVLRRLPLGGSNAILLIQLGKGACCNFAANSLQESRDSSLAQGP
jgi:hypothetical protein